MAVSDEIEPSNKRLAKVAIGLILVGSTWVAVIVPVTHNQLLAQLGAYAAGAGVLLLCWWIAGGRQ